jgi:hypothetical protein
MFPAEWAASIQPSIASLIEDSASCSVDPYAEHPGKSGAKAKKASSSSSQKIRTGYLSIFVMFTPILVDHGDKSLSLIPAYFALMGLKV